MVVLLPIFLNLAAHLKPKQILYFSETLFPKTTLYNNNNKSWRTTLHF